MSVRKVVKDGIPVGMNRGEAEDKRAQKMGELASYRRDTGHGGTRENVDGFAQVSWLCLVCGGRHEAPKEHNGGLSDRTCPHCGQISTHERDFPR